MCFIFFNSSRSGFVSNKGSIKITNEITKEYKKVSGMNKKSISLKWQEKINIFVRKNAHAFEFLVLSLLICLYFASKGYCAKKFWIYALFICLIYSVLDEFHQIFVPGRTSSVVDILYDFSGSIIGQLIYILFNNKKYKRLM